jgi:hypothetical protein
LAVDFVAVAVAVGAGAFDEGALMDGLVDALAVAVAVRVAPAGALEVFVVALAGVVVSGLSPRHT